VNPPSHLNARAKSLWKEISETYDLGPDHKELLLRLSEAVSRLDELRATLDAEGLTVQDRFAQARAHPLVVPEIQTRTQVARLLDQLGLDPDHPAGQEVRTGASALARKRWAR
jgi:P27 family predicted phage terminase small subunit